MQYHPRLAVPICTALILLSFPILLGEPVPTTPPEAPAFSMSNVVSDLGKKDQSILLELKKSAMAPNKESKNTSDSGVGEKMKATSEISRCLSNRSTITRHSETPTDPLYLALRKQTLADLDLKTAAVWWQYCKDESDYRSLKTFDEWPLAAQLKSQKAKTDAEFATLIPKQQGGKSGVESIGISLDSSISARWPASRKPTVSILDHIAGWNKLSAEEKSKLIIR
jgi:hypothetical protein